jgi:hypothetical protein
VQAGVTQTASYHSLLHVVYTKAAHTV